MSARCGPWLTMTCVAVLVAACGWGPGPTVLPPASTPPGVSASAAAASSANGAPREAAPLPTATPGFSRWTRATFRGQPFDWARPGPYLAPNWADFTLASFGDSQRVATTYYFYWYDLTAPEAQARLRQSWGDRPPDTATYTFANPAHHKRQFEDMQAAGLDFALPVYWGEPGHPGDMWRPTNTGYWSTDGIPAMVQALDEMAAEGHPFKIGLFLDTTIMGDADLTTEPGKAYLYLNLRDYYSRIPPRHWAVIGGRPVVWLYDAQHVAAFDQATFDDLYARFAQDFGGLRPYVVREWQWYAGKNVAGAQVLRTEGLYGWGAAPSGFNPDTRFTVAEVGPGFTNTRYCHDRPNCFDVGREGGARYEGQLRQALASGRQIIAVETWNEFSEGSEIAETVQYGRQYIDITRRHLDAWRTGKAAP